MVNPYLLDSHFIGGQHMQNAIILGFILGVMYLLFGLSLLFHANSWQQLLEKYQKDHFLLFPLMLVSTVFGLIILSMYNFPNLDFSILITVSGWGMVLKGAFYFLAPGNWIKTLLNIKNKKIFMYIGGGIALFMGCALLYIAMRYSTLAY